MGKRVNVTEWELAACVTGQENALHEMYDFANRIEKGYVDRISNPTEAAKQFALIARAASDMAVKMLYVDQAQRQKDDIARLRRDMAVEE